MERFSTRLFLIKFALEGTCLTSFFFLVQLQLSGSNFGRMIVHALSVLSVQAQVSMTFRCQSIAIVAGSDALRPSVSTSRPTSFLPTGRSSVSRARAWI